MGRVSLILLVFVLLVVATGSVSATAPIQNTGVWAPEPFELLVCDFRVVDSPVAEYREQIFFDNDGAFVKWRSHTAGTDYISAPGTSDVVLTGNFSIIEEWDELTQTFTVSGLDFNITVPGYGVVLFEAGRLTRHGEIVGIHTHNDPEKMAELCAILSGE